MANDSPTPDTASTSPAHIEPQAVVVPLTRAAIFLVLTIKPVRRMKLPSAHFAAILANCCARSASATLKGDLSCVMGIGSEAWDRLFGSPRPAELHPFREILAG